MRMLVLIFMFLGNITIAKEVLHKNKKNFRALTFNTGIARGHIPYADQRMSKVISEIKTSGADLVCLQEVWNEDDKDYFISKLKSEFPFYHRSIAKQKFLEISFLRPACRVRDLFGKNKPLSCLRSECKDKEGAELTKCIIRDCRVAMSNLIEKNNNCAQMFMAQSGKSTFRALLSMLNPIGKKGVFLYKGSNGLLMLSKRQLSNRGILDLSSKSTLINRTSLNSTLRLSEKDYTFSCSHLTADLNNSVLYAGEYGSWEDENYKQVTSLLNDISGSGNNNPQILLGDFNCSFAYGSVNSSFENSCQQFTDSGFEDITPDDELSCTYCSEENTLINENTGNYYLDHIFTKNINTNLVKSQIVLNKKFSFNDGKKTVESNLSDHYGLVLDLDID